MKTRIALGLAVMAALGCAATQVPQWSAGALLHPARRSVTVVTPPKCTETTFAGSGVTLAGWSCRASGARRGTLVYLHGIADNRSSAAGLVERFGTRGFDVIAYDSRAHGKSEGQACTYGFFEKDDLARVIERVDPGPVVLMGTSLGAAVALQTAAVAPRVTAVVAAETFSDLRTVATERAPFFFTRAVIDRAFEVAEHDGGFDADAVSPVIAASRITIPVLLIHGADDRDTPPDHSRRVLAALRGPKRLILVPNAQHNASLRGNVWNEVERWLDDALGDHLTRVNRVRE